MSLKYPPVISSRIAINNYDSKRTVWGIVIDNGFISNIKKMCKLFE